MNENDKDDNEDKDEYVNVNEDEIGLDENNVSREEQNNLQVGE